MKTLHVLDMSVPHVAGYTSRARSILEGQKRIGMEPVAVTGLRQVGGSADHDDIGGVRYHRTPPPRAMGGLARLPVAREASEMAALGRRVHELALAERPHVIHAHSPVLCGLPAHLVARRQRVASVYEIRAFWEDAAVDLQRTGERSPRYRAIRAAETWLARSVDALVVICDGLRRDLLARGLPGDRIFTVPNGVDPHRFLPAPRDEAFADRFGFRGKTVIAYIGTLFRFEGVRVLLDALDRITREDDSVRGLVVGYGETEDELRRRHAELGLGSRVVLTGKVPSSEISRYYALADVLCYPRERRRITELTTPLKPLEALCMEKAVLGSDVGGILELITDGVTGLAFKAGDVDDLVRAARTLIADPALRRRLGEAGRKDMLGNRDWIHLAQRYREVYASAKDRLEARAGRRTVYSIPTVPPSAPSRVQQVL